MTARHDRTAARGPSPWTRRLLGAAGVLILLCVWGLATLGVGSFFVPPPWTTLADAAVALANGWTWIQILITLLRVCLGFAVGYLVGAAAGIGIGSRAGLDALLKPFITFFQGMPPLLWAIPIIVILGIGHLPTILVIALITLPVVAVTVGEGMASLPREYAEMLDVFAPGFFPRLRELVFPHLRPFLGAALKVGLVLAVKASVTAEYFGANNGIGFQIQAAYQSLHIRRLFSWGLILILIILAFNHLLPRLGRALASARRAQRHLVSSRGAEWPVALPPDAGGARQPGLPAAEPQRISLAGVSFAYPRQSRALENISLEVPAGEIAVITGDSGIGKTTLLKLAARVLKPAEGTVRRPRRIGFAFQDDRLLPWRTVASNIALPLFYGGYSRAAAWGMAARLLADVGLAGEGGKMPGELSGGMRKRAALARCFARMPDGIFLDEPFSGLHGDARRGLWEQFLRLHATRPVPVIVVTHFPEELASARSCRFYRLGGRPATLTPLSAPRLKGYARQAAPSSSIHRKRSTGM